MAKAENYYTQGVYTPRFPNKYTGSFPIVYRSRPEFTVFQWMDLNPNVVTWTSESVIVPYIKPTDGKSHRYFVDFSCVYKQKNGQEKKYLLEYKPSKFTKPPQKTKRMSDKTFRYLHETWVMNKAKWAAATQFAKDRNAEFLVITENEIGLNNGKSK